MRPLYRNLLLGIAALNLIFWIFFAGHLLSPKPPKPVPQEIEREEQNSVQLTVPDDPIIYSGSGMLRVMDRVSACAEDGTDYTGRITVSVESASLAEKPLEKRILTYALKLSDGSVLTKERLLLLENYHGPSIIFTGAGTSVDTADLPRTAELLHGAGLLSAEDGFGHDISASLHAAPDTEIIQSGSYTFTISTENILGDTAELRTSLYVQAGESRVTLTLTAKTVTLPLGIAFDPMDYLASAWDSSEGDLSPYVRVTNTVNSSVPGTYPVTYTVSSLSGIAAEPQVLTVVIVP